MKTKIFSIFLLIFVYVLIWGAPLCAERMSQDFQARLLHPLASYSHPGTPFDVKILGPVLPPEGWTLPPGTVIRGYVRQAKPIGLGLRRERSMLELAFRGCELPTGEVVECATKLVSVDNARETVKKDSRIEGILSAAHPHTWLNGVWYRPTSEFFKRSPVGLTGAGGMLQSHFLPTPAGAALIIGLRFAFLRLPDPEIMLPAGTDLILRVSADEVAAALPLGDAAGDRALPDNFVQWLRETPSSVHRLNRPNARDLMNVVLLGTRDQLDAAFASAGWSEAEPRSAKAFIRTYAAYSSMKTYATAPVSSMYYQGRLPDMVFQKSFNSVAKRHHIRLWQVDSPYGPAWLGAATHDTGIMLRKNMTISHRIDLNIDRERSVVLNDLLEARCLQDSSVIQRPDVSLDAGRIVTDGSIAVGKVAECAANTGTFPALAKLHRKVPALVARRAILETRYYFTRGNTYYWAYQGLRHLSSKRSSESANVR